MDHFYIVECKIGRVICIILHSSINYYKIKQVKNECMSDENWENLFLMHLYYWLSNEKQICFGNYVITRW